MQAFAKTVSYLFHPLLVATYLLLLLLIADPFLFGVNGIGERFPLVALVFGSSFLVPGLVVLMMVGLEMIPSIHMPEREQRTVPLIAVGMLYLGLFAFCRNDVGVPALYTGMVLGCVVGLFTAFFINLFSKISLHGVGMGGLVAATAILVDRYGTQALTVPVEGGLLEASPLIVLLLAVTIAGLVGTCRLVLHAHVLQDVLGGYLVGFTTMLIATWVYA